MSHVIRGKGKKWYFSCLSALTGDNMLMVQKFQMNKVCLALTFVRSRELWLELKINEHHRFYSEKVLSFEVEWK